MGLIDAMVYKLWSWMNSHKVDYAAHKVDYTAHKADSDAHHTPFTGTGFRARREIVQAIPTNTWTDVVFPTEDFDIDGDYDDTTGIFTPSTAGYYSVHGNIVFSALGDGNLFILALCKNGPNIVYDRGVTGGAGNCGGCVSSIVYMNGTTDYLKIVCYHTFGANRDLGTWSGWNSFSAWQVTPP